MIINIILCIIIAILVWRIFKFDKYTKNDFYKDMINICDWLITKFERIKQHFNFKLAKQ